MTTENVQRRRFSYLTKLIVDEDIPVADLHDIGIPNVGDNRRYSSPDINSDMDGVSSIGSSEFHSEAYLEYRRRVFEQLAVEYEKEKQQKQQLEILPENELIEPSYDNNDLLHSSYYDVEEIKDESEDLLKQSPELQPAWDDSDLKSHAYISTPEIEIGTGPLWQKAGKFHELITEDNYHEPTEVDEMYNLNDWTMFDAHIQKATKAASNEQLKSSIISEAPPLSPVSRRRGSKKSFKKSSHKERESLQNRMLIDDLDEDEENSHKPWQQKKYERPYSAQNQSLQICYINESCSSDESDGGKKSSDKANHNNPQEKSPVSPAFSPTNSPGFMSPKGYGKRYLRQNRLSNASSHSSSSSSLSFQNNTSENTIIHHHHSDLRSGRSKQEELEIEARFQLAEAQQKAKLEAEEFKKRPKTRDLSLRSTLSEELQRKISCYGLTGKDCQRMKLKQLQVILKDLQIKQQVLSGSLVQLLLERDGLQTEQDSKLLDIEDIKTMMSSLGPETTV